MQTTPPPARPPRAILWSAIGLGLVAEVLFYGFPLGLNFPLWVALVLGASFLVRPAGSRVAPLDAWLPLTALLFAALVAIRADPLLLGFDTLAATALTAGSVAAFAGIDVTARSIAAISILASWFGARTLLGVVPLLPELTRERRAADRTGRGSRHGLPVARGALLAIPVLLVFTALFASADAVFGRIAGSVLTLSVDLGDLPARLGFVLLAAWVVAAVLLISATGRAGAPAEPVTTAGTRRSPLFDGFVPLVGPTEALVVLVALNVLFALFVVLQVAYLFGGRDTLAASGLTYSDYARRGFFELIAVVVLVGGLLVALETAITERTRAYVGATVGLVALSGVVLASAFVRLRLYQDVYGWTELRFYALTAIFWLAICLTCAAATILFARTRWLLHLVAIAALVVALGVNVLDPPAFVASENIARALDPTRVPPDGKTGLDEVYLAVLGYDAVPVVVDALPRLSDQDRTFLGRALTQLRTRLDAGPTAPQAWNFSRERARSALESAVGVR